MIAAAAAAVCRRIAARRAAMFLVIDGEPHDVFRMAPVGVRLWIGPLVRLW